MKRFSALLLMCLMALGSMAQLPEKFFYQAVARDVGGALMINSSISMRLSLIPDNPLNGEVYQELHAVTTSFQGLVNLEVGAGLVTIGDFTTIDWSTGTYYLKVELDPLGGLTFFEMGTTQLISVPYALHAKTADFVDDADADPSNEIQTLSFSAGQLTISDGNTIMLPPGGGGGGGSLDASYDAGGAGVGRTIDADAGAVEINSSNSNGFGLAVTNTASNGVAIAAENTDPNNTFSAIQATTNINNIQGSAILGNTSNNGWGVTGQVEASGLAESAVLGNNFRAGGGHGVLGYGYNGTVGQTNYRPGYGVYGENYDLLGAISSLAIGTAGRGYYGVLGEDRYLGGAVGAYGVFSNGDMGSSGLKLFQIDLPEDPENYYLRHFCIESDEVLNMYRGNVVLDENGEAVVTMPQYFHDVNINFSYVLTPIGAPAQLYIKEKIEGEHFSIAGGLANQEVSWVVYAERNDPYLQQYPERKQNVVAKTDRDRGTLQMPKLYGAGEEKATFKSPTKQGQIEVKVQTDK